MNKRIPKHVAIIMDGNGRWARKRQLSRSQGHIEGVKRAEDIIDIVDHMGIKVLTLFTFSTENWNRPETEVSMLMNIIDTVLKKKLNKLKKRDMVFNIIGRKDRIPEPVITSINTVIEQTKNNSGMVVNLAFNYGARLEIIDAIKGIVGDVQTGRITPEQINEELFASYLYTKNLPDPDLLIRTSGEHRISNFLLWQLSYAEFYFTDVLWPDFDKEQFEQAIQTYQHRNRRFGGINSKG
jgi:undecaprenyl diphosphate synthase